MHEMSIAQSLLSIVEQEMARNQVTRLEKVKVKCGQINGVVPEALEFAFQTLTRETSLEGAELEIETVPLRLQCSQCETSFQARTDDTIFFHLPCPTCGHDFGHTVLAGKELNIDYIEATTAGDAQP